MELTRLTSTIFFLTIIIPTCLSQIIVVEDDNDATSHEAIELDMECAQFQFKCADGSECISMLLECDKIDHCDDGSDEHKDCSYFQCHDGRFISSKFLCDGYKDCDDNEDEEESAGCFHVACDNGQKVPETNLCNGFYDCADTNNTDECDCDDTFLCDNGKCLVLIDTCNGFDECGDNSDEVDCGGYFTCSNGVSVLRRKVCDGFSDCYDGGDEVNCFQTSTATEMTTSTFTPPSVSTHKDVNNFTGMPTNHTALASSITPHFLCRNERQVSQDKLCDGVDDCQDGYRSDECNCKDSFVCPETNSCILYSQTCDGDIDCPDGADENPILSGCGATPMFECANGRMIDSELVCNRVDDCEDGTISDECSCEYMREICINMNCILPSKMCDGKNDCGDCSDERNCTGSLLEQMNCGDDTCVPLNRRCNSVKDCSTGADEEDCPDDYDYYETNGDGDYGNGVTDHSILKPDQDGSFSSTTMKTTTTVATKKTDAGSSSSFAHLSPLCIVLLSVIVLA